MKKQTVTFLFFFVGFIVIITIAGSLVPVPVSNEQAIMTYLRENFGQSKTAWLDTIDSIQAVGPTVVITTRKSRHNDAVEICEAVSTFIFGPAAPRQMPAKIEVRTSEKVLVRRDGVNDHCE